MPNTPTVNPYQASKAKHFAGLDPDDNADEARRAWSQAAHRWMEDPDFAAYCDAQTPIPVLMFRDGSHG